MKRNGGNISALIQLIQNIYLEEPLSPPWQRWTASAWANTDIWHCPHKVYLITLITLLCFSGHVSLCLIKFASLVEMGSVWEWRFNLHRLHWVNLGTSMRDRVWRHSGTERWKNSHYLIFVSHSESSRNWQFVFTLSFRHYNDFFKIWFKSVSWSPTCILERKLFL